MELLLIGGSVWIDGHVETADVSISSGRIVSVSSDIPHAGFSVINLNGCLLVPGFVDAHVHLREPGFLYKETIASGTQAAAAGGYTAVCAMPNVKPVPDNVKSLSVQKEVIEKQACIRVYPYGAITCGEKGESLADLTALSTDVIGFSDDGRGVQNELIMYAAMGKAKQLNLPIVAHCEDESLLEKGWSIHAGTYARQNGLIGNDPASEWRQVERDLDLVERTNCRYHVCHVSTKESVALIRKAKGKGLCVTCETAPHYLLLTEEDLQDEGRFRMNPPIRSLQDRLALIDGLIDGTIDCIATDHAPHSVEEKMRGLAGSLNGVVGLECALSVLYTGLVETGIVPFKTILNALCVNPRKIFGIDGGKIAVGEIADLTVLNLHDPHKIDAQTFLSKGRATPFDGWNVNASVMMTICNGEIVYKKELL